MDTDDTDLMLEEEDLDLALSASSESAAAAVTTDNQYRNSMLELEQTLEEETKDITSRFQSERRPEPAGLDRALSDSYGNYDRSHQRGPGDAFAQQRYASRSGGFVTGFDPLSKEEKAKKANRAQRFGALPQAESEPKDEIMDEQGSSMDVDDGDWVRPHNLPETPPRTSTIRPEAVHLYGTDEMSTKDVLAYFEAYGPSHVEWIDDSSCNVVFPDVYSAKRALYYQLVDGNVNFGEDEDGQQQHQQDQNGNDTTTITTATLNTGTTSADVEPSRSTSLLTQSADGTPAIVVPRSNNRLQRAKEYVPVQIQHQPTIRHNAGLFVRYATDYDRKERGAAARSQYYAIHGREEARSGSSSSSSRYGRRSRADDDEIWNRGRGIQTMSSLRRKIEGGGEEASRSPSPSSRDHRSWSRNRRLEGSRSRSRSRSWSRTGSRSPARSSGRDRGSRSPESRSRLQKRGRRGDISLRLGGRVKVPIEDEIGIQSSAAATDRINQYADDFLAELESTFSRREKQIPKTKMYSDFYEREIVTEKPIETASGRERRRERGGYSDDRREGGSGGSGRRRSRRDHNDFGGGTRRKDNAEALRAIESRLGLPAEDKVDEFGRTSRD
ncbi:hypothetical protein BGX28_007586 [Mortierella sp. GBA30]|nr:hypothetical protein BGX28_007586 [Mortierella sp. GBA30]